MKKIFYLMLAFCLFLPCLILGGCNHEHEFGLEWTSDATHHWHKCNTCGDVKDKATHNWDAGVVLKDASMTENGVKLFICNDCKLSKTETFEYVSTVSATEWVNAFNLKAYEKYTLEVESDYSQKIIKNGNIIYYLTPDHEAYLVDETTSITKYQKNDGSWEKIEDYTIPGVSDVLDEYDGTYLINHFKDEMDSFVYNPTTKAYENENYTIDGDDEAYSLQLFFENGKLVKYAVDGGYGELTITYDAIALVLPQVD